MGPDADHAWVADPADGFDAKLEFMSREQHRARFGHDPHLP